MPTVTAIWTHWTFNVFDPSVTTWNAVPGIYIFAGRDPLFGRWQAVYVGQARSFADRLPSHERWAEAVRSGATHVHALVVHGDPQRDAIERALIAAHAPRLNVQHNGLRRAS